MWEITESMREAVTKRMCEIAGDKWPGWDNIGESEKAELRPVVDSIIGAVLESDATRHDKQET